MPGIPRHGQKSGRVARPRGIGALGQLGLESTGVIGSNQVEKQPIATVVPGAKSRTNTKRRHERDYSFFGAVSANRIA